MGSECEVSGDRVGIEWGESGKRVEMGGERVRS